MLVVKNRQNPYIVKIPKDITVIYSSQKKIIIFRNVDVQKSLNLKVKIKLLNGANLIKITQILFNAKSNNERKTVKAIQGTTVSLIKQLLIETSVTLNYKLKLVGVGYRVLNVENNNTLLLFKLGFSHSIYFKVPENLKITSLKFTKLFICGNSYNFLTQTVALIRMLKKPEPYKGKGILYETEKIVLKEGKKV
jgi:large subunit ribosomal protein L6